MMKKINCKTFSFVVLGALMLTVGCSTPPKNSPSKKYTKREQAQLLVTASVGAMNDKDPISALQYLQRAEEIDSGYAAIYHARTQAYLMKKDRERAIESIEKALDIDSNDSGILNTAGRLYLDAGKTDEAEKYLKKAASDPLFREAWKAMTTLGILYYRKNQLDLADSQLRRAISEEPTMTCVAHYYRGHIEMKRNQLQSAQKSYEKASSKICATFADAHFAHGMALERGKKYNEARRKYLELQQVFPESSIAEQAMNRLKHLP